MRGRNNCFLPPQRLSGGPGDGRQGNLGGTVLAHKLNQSIFLFRLKNIIQPPLVTHLPTLSGGSKSRVLVPLCGKAGCLTHLYNAGHDVVGAPRTYSIIAFRD